MKMALSLWDYLFGREVTIELPGPDNELIQRKVTKKWIESKQREGNMVKTDVVRVHVLHVISGVTIQHWSIGEDIDAEAVEKFRDSESGAIYAMVHFENGEEVTHLMAKHLWEDSRRKLAAV